MVVIKRFGSVSTALRFGNADIHFVHIISRLVKGGVYAQATQRILINILKAAWLAALIAATPHHTRFGSLM